MASIIIETGERSDELVAIPFCSFKCWNECAIPGDNRRDFINSYEFAEFCANCGKRIV